MPLRHLSTFTKANCISKTAARRNNEQHARDLIRESPEQDAIIFSQPAGKGHAMTKTDPDLFVAELV
jgi:hypothetical protein